MDRGRMAGNLATMAKAVRILCAVVLLSLGFAHAPVKAAAAAYGTAYQLPDGTFADLCRDGRHAADQHLATAFCEVCRLAASILLPQPDSETWLKTVFARLAAKPRSQPAVRGHVAALLPQSRAPPRAA